MTREFLKRYLDELKRGVGGIRILDPDSPDYEYQQWAIAHGPAIAERLNLEGGGLVIERPGRGLIIDYRDDEG